MAAGRFGSRLDRNRDRGASTDSLVARIKLIGVLGGRVIAAFVLGILIGVAWWYFVGYVLDQSKCDGDRECSLLGDLTYNVADGWLMLIASLAAGASIVWQVSLRRRPSTPGR